MWMKRLITGPLQVNTYILICEKSGLGAIIDPGGSEREILQLIQQKQAKLKYIINTHGHPDHILGNNYLKTQTNAQILIHREDAFMLEDTASELLSYFQESYVPVPADKLLQDGEDIHLGEISLKVLHTPGHTPGGICLLTASRLFSGDTLFAGGIGRTDFPGGSYQTLIASIESKLFTLEPDLQVLPGHGPSSTIGTEKSGNPFF
ncbi:MAG: MBL fold metallo-hydrolase [Candidatus Schekmanbacteria bacterium]|nr:MBL fold metallo-hydrolase [Candidatus Schekmanbacteria bacterium]